MTRSILEHDRRSRAASRRAGARIALALALLATALVAAPVLAQESGPAAGTTVGPDTQPALPAPADTLQDVPAEERGPDVIFVPTPDSVVVAMLRVADVDEDDLVYDLGSGDGRIVIAAAKRFGARGIGIDIDPQRISEARANAERQGVQDRVEFVRADLFEAEFGDATAVTLYLLSELNRRVRPMLFDQLAPGTPVVSHGFDMGEWEPDSNFTVENRQVYFWIVPANVGGTWTWDAGRRPREASLELRQKFQELDGTMRVDGATFELVDPVVRGDSLRFRARGSIDGDPVTLAFAGRVRADALQGTMQATGGPFEGRRTWRARRESPQREEIAPTDSVDLGRDWAR